MTKKDLSKIDADLFALLKEKGPQTRMDILEAIDALNTPTEADAAGARLIKAGVATTQDKDGYPAFVLLEGAEFPAPGPKSEPPDTSAIDPAWTTGEETRQIPDRRLLCRITPERRAALNAEDAELSREEARLEDTISAAKERLKVIHEKRMTAARASQNDTEHADVPCKEILRFAAGLAFAVRCDPREAWPDGWPEDGVIGDPRALTKEDMQVQLPLDDSGCVNMDAVAKLCGADGVEAGAVQETPKRKGRPPGSKNKAKGGAK